MLILFLNECRGATESMKLAAGVFSPGTPAELLLTELPRGQVAARVAATPVTASSAVTASTLSLTSWHSSSSISPPVRRPLPPAVSRFQRTPPPATGRRSRWPPSETRTVLFRCGRLRRR